MDIFELAKARILAGGSGKGFYSTEENDAGGTTYVFKATESGRKSVTKKDINFYDYDGTLLYSYTLAQAQALKELPPLPKQDGLICQEWNYDLDTIKSYNRAVDVGATYITDDGKTRLYIKIAADGRMDVPLYFSQTVENGVMIDWGDGSAIETLSGTGSVNTAHTYASIGDYVITLNVADGCTLGLGHRKQWYCVLGSSGSNGQVYCNMLQKVEVGNGVTSIGNYAFDRCYSLANITIPNSVKSVNDCVFFYCYSLASIIIPNSVTSIGSEAFRNCYSLANIIIPNSVTTIYSRAFINCNSLASIVIPNSVTIITSGMLSSCFSLASIVIHNSVTRIDGNAFSGCHSLASITIPNGVMKIDSNAFYNCYSLANIMVPNSVTSIGTGAFYYCYGMKYYDFTKHTAVPTLERTDAFNNSPSDCEIRVPAALYDEWIAATNWSAYADKIVAI